MLDRRGHVEEHGVTGGQVAVLAAVRQGRQAVRRADDGVEAPGVQGGQEAGAAVNQPSFV